LPAAKKINFDFLEDEKETEPTAPSTNNTGNTAITKTSDCDYLNVRQTTCTNP